MTTGPSGPISCQQARDLWDAYTLALSDYNRTMRAHPGTSPEAMKLRVEASDRRNEARKLYLAHVREHGCGGPSPGSAETE